MQLRVSGDDLRRPVAMEITIGSLNSYSPCGINEMLLEGGNGVCMRSWGCKAQVEPARAAMACGS